MLRKAAVTTLALGVLSCAQAPGSAPAAGVTGSWSGGKTSEYYYFAPSITITRSGGRYTGTNTAPFSWSLPQGQQNISGLQSSCTVPANTHVLKLRRQKGKKNSFTGSVILIYNLLTQGPGQPTPVPFACQVHLYGALVSVASNGKSFRLRSMDGPDTFPTVTYRKG
jgi:hypothetical protein